MDVKENSEQQQEEEQVDVFDLLPDALVLEIFNRVQDARSLSACTILCKRFGDLVTQTETVSLQIIARRNTTSFQELSSKSGDHISNNKSKGGFLGRFILKPVNDFLRRMMSRKPKPCCEDEEEENTFRLPNELLKNFKEVKSLAIKLPGYEGDVSPNGSGGALLKWKAEFGKELESCVILGATGFKKSENSTKDETKGKVEDVISTTNHLTNKQLKKRVVWTISCLIACSARHHMLKQIISVNRMLRNVKITDGSKQGTIDMKERQVFDVRNDTMCSEKTSDLEMERTKVPAVIIKMWYMPMLELPESGGVMKGATLAVIRPVIGTTVEKQDDVTLAMGAFEDKFVKEAVKKLVEKKRSYTLEMNSF
uniref:F-box protein At4g18380-like n=1 Tax=Erigeron canadensis TaxID=72917 RepID=UPI001CB90B3C|nr:F-box protein At4g18380-like [Erigeron canadensis]